MRHFKRLPPFLLGRAQWVFLSAVVLLVLPAVLAIVFAQEIHSAYLHQFVGPRLEQKFGFAGQVVAYKDGCCLQEVFIVGSVIPNGVLDVAGFRSGDMPVGYKHGFEVGFYQDLLAAEDGASVEIEVRSAPDWRESRTLVLGTKPLPAN